MKKVLLSSIMLLITTIAVFAYETVIIKYPENENWVKVYYKKIGNEAIAQYAPKGQTHNNWQRSVIIHAYKDSAYPIRVFMTNSLGRMEKANKTTNYTIVKQHEFDSMAVRCTEQYHNIVPQCEIFRGTRAHDGIISIHYINKDRQDFMKNYTQWYEIIKRAKPYNTYYRDERILDKAEYVEFY